MKTKLLMFFVILSLLIFGSLFVVYGTFFWQQTHEAANKTSYTLVAGIPVYVAKDVTFVKKATMLPNGKILYLVEEEERVDTCEVIEGAFFLVKYFDKQEIIRPVHYGLNYIVMEVPLTKIAEKTKIDIEVELYIGNVKKDSIQIRFWVENGREREVEVITHDI